MIALSLHISQFPHACAREGALPATALKSPISGFLAAFWVVAGRCMRRCNRLQGGRLQRALRASLRGGLRGLRLGCGVAGKVTEALQPVAGCATVTGGAATQTTGTLPASAAGLPIGRNV
jgi:hypothetical protein